MEKLVVTEEDSKEVEVEGKTLSLAIEKGLKILHREQGDVDVYMVHEPLSRAELYKVKLRVKRERVKDFEKFEPVVVKISSDELEAYLSLNNYNAIFSSNKSMASEGKETIELDGIYKMLELEEITYGIDDGAIKAALEKYHQGEDMCNKVIARGDDPVNGQDASIEYCFKSNTDAGKVDPFSGKTDFRERGIYRAVQNGETLAIKTMATEGRPGRTVTGVSLPQKRGHDRRLVAGKNIEVIQDSEGVLRYVAMADGIPSLYADRIEVRDQLVIKNDVDFSTGNIEAGGDVRIQGRVASGFRVRATGNIYIGDTVEGAFIEAGKDVFLKTGIKGHNKGYIKAGGNVQARYLERCGIESGKDIIVHDSVIECNVLCAGRLLATDGRGTVIGGIIKATNGIDVNILGSDAYRLTKVIAGIDYIMEKELKKVRDEIDQLKANQSRFIEILGRYNMDEKVKEGLKKELAESTSNLVRLFRDRDELMGKPFDIYRADIRVRKMLYPGVLIIIGHDRLHNRQERSRIRFYLSSKRKKISIADI